MKNIKKIKLSKNFILLGAMVVMLPVCLTGCSIQLNDEEMEYLKKEVSHLDESLNAGSKTSSENTNENVDENNSKENEVATNENKVNSTKKVFTVDLDEIYFDSTVTAIIRAYDSNGDVVWENKIKNDRLGQFDCYEIIEAYLDGEAEQYVYARIGTDLVCYEKATGKEVWKKFAIGAYSSDVCVIGDNMLVKDQTEAEDDNSRIMILNRKTGEEIFGHDFSEDIVEYDNVDYYISTIEKDVDENFFSFLLNPGYADDYYENYPTYEIKINAKTFKYTVEEFDIDQKIAEDFGNYEEDDDENFDFEY